MTPGVSAGSNQVGASEMLTAMTICPSAASAGGGASAAIRPVTSPRTSDERRRFTGSRAGRMALEAPSRLPLEQVIAPEGEAGFLPDGRGRPARQERVDLVLGDPDGDVRGVPRGEANDLGDAPPHSSIAACL